jgi:hypothetical protein
MTNEISPSHSPNLNGSHKKILPIGFRVVNRKRIKKMVVGTPSSDRNIRMVL